MCGRFVVTTDPALLAEKLQALDECSAPTTGSVVPAVTSDEFAASAANYNVAPTATVATLVTRHSGPGDDPTRRLRLMRWGLVPPWAKAAPDGTPDSTGPLLINARADKAMTSPAFRVSAKSKRCLIPMDGYYEWRANPDTAAGKKARKTPFYMYREAGEMLLVAGLWSVWKNPGNRSAQPLLSCTIITTDAVGELADIHDRMPLMVAERDWETWLDPDVPPSPKLLANPPDVRGIRLREVSTLVNSVRNNGPELLEPAEPQAEQVRLF